MSEIEQTQGDIDRRMQQEAEDAAASMDLDADDADGWRPGPGDLLIGEVVKVGSGWSDFKNDVYPIVTVKRRGTENDLVAVHCFHYTLEDRVIALKPQVGEQIGIRYKGKVDSKDGKRKISVYNVKIQGRDADPWSSFTSPRRQQTREAAKQESQQQQMSVAQDDDIPF